MLLTHVRQRTHISTRHETSTPAHAGADMSTRADAGDAISTRPDAGDETGTRADARAETSYRAVAQGERGAHTWPKSSSASSSSSPTSTAIPSSGMLAAKPGPCRACSRLAMRTFLDSRNASSGSQSCFWMLLQRASESEWRSQWRSQCSCNAPATLNGGVSAPATRQRR